MGQKVSHVQTQDSIIPGFDAKDFYFSSPGNVNAVAFNEQDMINSAIPFEYRLINFAFHLEDRGDVYVRRVYGLFDLISHFGGLALGLLLILNVFMGSYA